MDRRTPAWRRARRRAARRAVLASAAIVASLAAGLVAVLHDPPASAAPLAFRTRPLPSDQVDGQGLAVLQVGSRVYVGGLFGHVRGPDGATLGARANLAAFDAGTGRLITTFRADADGPVRALATDGRRLFVGGSFRRVNGLARARLAAVDLATGAVDAAWSADANSNVYGLTVHGPDLYVVGSFTAIAGAARTRAATVATATGAIGPFAPRLDGTTISVAVSADGSRIYLGGGFATVDGVAAPWLAVLDGGTRRLAPVQLHDVGGPASAIRVSADGTRVVASLQGTANAGTTWRTADGVRTWRQRCDGDGQAIDLVGDVVISGFHEGCEGDTTIRLTANQEVTGVRDPTFTPAFDRFWGIYGIAATTERLVVAGDFTAVSGVAVQGFAIFPNAATPPPPTTTTTTTTTTRPVPTTTTTRPVPTTTTTRPVPTTTTTTPPPPSPPVGAFPFGLRSSWRYHDAATPPVGDWKGRAYADATWKVGAGQLGYGDGDEATVIWPGSQNIDRPLTAWFRRSFTITTRPASLQLQLVADDGAVVYLNGVEIVRDGMPAGPIGPGSYALDSRSEPAENAVRRFTVPATALVVGTNVLAVEVHQNYRRSPDLSFDAALS